jgi:hypothetical protein
MSEGVTNSRYVCPVRPSITRYYRYQVQAVLFRIPEVPFPNLYPATKSPQTDCSGFIQSVQPNSRKVPVSAKPIASSCCPIRYSLTIVNLEVM